MKTDIHIVYTQGSHSKRTFYLSALRPKGSDCGVVNVNIPTSGAEIGGAFGETFFVDFTKK